MQVKSLPRRNGDTCSVRPNSGCQGYAIAAKRKLYVECRLLSAAAPKDVEITSMRVAVQILLDQPREARDSTSHVGMAGRKPNPDIAGDRNHRRSSTSRTRASASGSTCAS